MATEGDDYCAVDVGTENAGPTDPVKFWLRVSGLDRLKCVPDAGTQAV